ncbi:hypothetical protein [Streptantibioticus silvisoli]|uniref:Uncharacterized protein n=1 Tax=Streptantibioticus silvisoli TaxID=2705255 RepID=A0ABT6W4T8_9ACTN|nr:hypothetical protein [Streptantibioticus silvisoli]MDI5965774.1 hypothetical protein [Streptantibioticus silvisoli]
MSERSIQFCPDCHKAISIESARPGVPAKSVHIGTRRETCE